MVSSNSDPDRIINLTPALARLENDRELLCDLARFYLEDGPQLLQEIQHGIDTSDFELITRSAHSLKGLASNFDAHATVAAALAIELAGRQQELECIEQLLPDLQLQSQKVVVALEAELLS